MAKTVTKLPSLNHQNTKVVSCVVCNELYFLSLNSIIRKLKRKIITKSNSEDGKIVPFPPLSFWAFSLVGSFSLKNFSFGIHYKRSLILLYRRACGHVDEGTCPHQVLAATLTLSQPRGADYAHPILVSTSSFESHRRTCNPRLFNHELFIPMVDEKSGVWGL